MSALLELCLRDELIIIEPSEDAPGRYLIRRPDNEDLLELGEEEIFLCRQLETGRDAQVICAAFAERFGMEVAPQQLLDFYREMQDLGLLGPCDERAPEAAEALAAPLDEVGPGKGAPAERSRPYRWKLFDPEVFLGALARLLYPLRHGVWLLLPGVPLAVLALLFNQPEYRHALSALVGGPGLLALLSKVVFTLFVVNLTSKVIQGVTCVHFGGSVEQFGIRLAFGFLPRFYIDKRHIWNLHRRGQLWTFAAPLLNKLGLFVSGTLLWLWTANSGTALPQYAFIIGQFGLGSFLFTANPLWRADGYAWLVSYLGLPQLRQRAFKVAGMVLRGRSLPQELSARERSGLLAYALASGTFLIVLISGVLISLAVKLETHYSGLGVALFLILLASMLRFFLVRQQRKTRSEPLRRGATLAAASPPASVAAPRRERASPATGKPRARSRRGGKRWGWLLLGLALVGSAWLPYPFHVGGGVTLLPRTYSEARARTSGEVLQVLVQEGEWVRRGQLLAELDGWKVEHDIGLMEKQLEKAQHELDLLLAGPRSEQVTYAQEQVSMAKVKASHSGKLMDVLRPGLSRGSVSAIEYAKAEADADVDNAAVSVAQANLALTASGPLELEIAIKRAEVDRTQRELDYLRSARERTQIQSPTEGRLATARLQQRIGNFLQEGDLFSVIEDTRVIHAEILVPETDVGDVRVGASVMLKVWAYPDDAFEGLVTSIAPVVEEDPNSPFVRVVRVSTETSNADGRLKSQMTGFAKIDAGDKPVAVAFTRALARFFSIEIWSWLP